jgi:hypothetical protein
MSDLPQPVDRAAQELAHGGDTDSEHFGDFGISQSLHAQEEAALLLVGQVFDGRVQP